MKNSLFLFFSQYRLFWWLRSFAHRVYFWVGAQVFQSKFYGKDKKDSFVGFRRLLQRTQLQLILALLFAMSLQFIDPVVLRFYNPTFLQIPDDSDYVTFLVTISGIGGVFIGLYYAAISTIAGSIYARVPNNIRDLLAQERVGNVYMNFLSFVTFLGISLVSFRVLGFDRIYLAVPVMLVASGVGIIAFVKLGQRAFYLFDPTALSQHLFDQLRQFLSMVTAGDYRWNDVAFQRHANKLASSHIDTLETLSDITRKEVHLCGRPFIALSESLISFLLSYEKSKKHIPSDSQWYEQKYVHKDWYLTDDSRVSIAHQTGTSLHPDVSYNNEWVEDRVLPIIRECLKINLTEARFKEVLELAEYIDAYLRQLARSGRTEHALGTLEELVADVIETISPVSEKEIVSDEVLEKMAIIEKFASIPITIALACKDHIKEVKPEEIERKLTQITWRSDADIYRHGFASYCLPRLEWFKPRLSFEISTEGRRVTPLWYQKELLLQIEAASFAKNTKALIELGSNLYKSWITRTTDAKHPWLVGAVMSRELEYWHKVNPQVGEWSSKWSVLSDKRKIEGLSWSEFDVEHLKNVAKNRQAELLELMSTQNLILSFLKRSEGFPDYAGQFLHSSGEALLEALLNNDQDIFRKVFPKYFYGSITKFNNLRPISASMDWRIQQDIKIAVAPLLDLMELSGYSRLMADYHNNEQLWQIVTDTWNGYFAKEGESSPLALLVAAIKLTESTFGIPHRGILRTKWHIKIGNKLSDVPRHEVYSNNFYSSEKVIEHDSPLIRVFAKERYGSSYDGLDIFITYYLRTKGGDEQLDCGWKRRNLQESLDREARNNFHDEPEREVE